MWIVLVTLPKKKMISRGTEQVSRAWLAHQLQLAQLSHQSFSHHKQQTPEQTTDYSRSPWVQNLLNLHWSSTYTERAGSYLDATFCSHPPCSITARHPALIPVPCDCWSLQSRMPFAFSKPARSAAAVGNSVLPQTGRTMGNFDFTLVKEATGEAHPLVGSEQEAVSPSS